MLYRADTSRSHIPSLEGLSEDHPSYPQVKGRLPPPNIPRGKHQGHDDLQKIKPTLCPSGCGDSTVWTEQAGALSPHRCLPPNPHWVLNGRWKSCRQVKLTQVSICRRQPHFSGALDQRCRQEFTNNSLELPHLLQQVLLPPINPAPIW